MAAFAYKRIVVVGTTGCGKSTLAERLAGKLGLAFIELDALYWKPNWVGASDDEFYERIRAAIQSPGWAVAGNYGRARDQTWPLAEAVIWLDYSFWVIFWRLWRRTWRRVFTQELLWGTNRERPWMQLKVWSQDSLFNWFFKTYWRRKREYPLLFSRPEYAHLEVIRFRSPREAEDWLENLGQDGATG
jgi:adenylate kinase family enzyme